MLYRIAHTLRWLRSFLAFYFWPMLSKDLFVTRKRTHFRLSLGVRNCCSSSGISAQEVKIATAISSLGLIWMTGRQAILAYSLLASFPAWQRVDPLLLLEKEEADEDEQGAEENHIDIADHLFSNINAT